MTVPLIGIVADRKAASYGAWVDIPNDAIPHAYVSAVQEAGGAPIIFPSLDVHVDDPERLIDLIDGLFLPGGRDLDAELYGSVDDRLDFLIESNGLTGSEILELPRGRAIVYYQ